MAKSFRLSTKTKLSIVLSFLLPFVSFIGVFSSLKCKTLVLKTTTRWKRASHFIDGWHLLTCQIRFFPHPLNGWHDHWTFVGKWGMDDFIDLVWRRIFSQTSLELEIFSPTYNGVRVFFPASSAIFFSQEYICMLFRLEFSLQYIFPEITHDTLKIQMVGP